MTTTPYIHVPPAAANQRAAGSLLSKGTEITSSKSIQQRVAMQTLLAVSLVFTILALNCKATSSMGLPVGVSGQCSHHLSGKPAKHGCASDGDCPEETHCCTLDCGPVCVPRTHCVKHGVCPPSLASGGVCAEYCANDSECPGVQKCCATTCGHQCTDPYLVKRGRCPDPKPTGLCAEFCHHDGDCSDHLKCCPSTCGHLCTDPCN